MSQVHRGKASRERMSRMSFEFLHFEPHLLADRLPLVIYLHGAGQKGTSLDALSKASLPALLSEGLEVPAHVVCPLAKPGPGWPVNHVAVFAEEICRRLGADPMCIYLTGESMGGRGVFEVAYWYHHLLAAIAPICAFGIPNLAPVLSALPIWMFHGSADEVLPVARSEEMASALALANPATRFTRLEGEGHNIGRIVYSRPELWSWMLSQKRVTSQLELQ